MILCLFLSLHAFGEDDDRMPVIQEHHVKVSVISPQKADMNVPIDVQGQTEEVAKHVLNAPFEGVLSTKVSNTQYVKKGTIIAVIQNRSFANKQTQLKNNLSLYNEQLMFETKKLQSSDEMLKMGLISKNDYLTQQSQLNEKKISVSNTKSEIGDLKQTLSRGIIRSPINGYISDLQADGTYLTYANPICNITNASANIRLFIPMQYAKSITRGQKVMIHLQDSTITASISQILPTATANLIEAIATTKEALPVGLNVQASIQTANKKGWIVPKESIVLIQNRPALFIISNNTAHLHFVNVQKDLINKVLITDDLNKLDHIAYKNAYMLEENSVVEIIK